MAQVLKTINAGIIALGECRVNSLGDSAVPLPNSITFFSTEQTPYDASFSMPLWGQLTGNRIDRIDITDISYFESLWRNETSYAVNAVTILQNGTANNTLTQTYNPNINDYSFFLCYGYNESGRGDSDFLVLVRMTSEIAERITRQGSLTVSISGITGLFYSSMRLDNTFLTGKYSDGTGNGTPDGKPIIVPPEDLPTYPFGPESEQAGGGGTFDDKSSNINFPDLPSTTLDTKMFRMYNPTKTQLSDLGSYLWSNSFQDVIDKIMSNPMDAIINLSLTCAPVNPSFTADIIIGNADTNVHSQVVTNQFVTLDCGSVELKEFWGNALDYSPYTSVQIFLPFIGIRDLNVDDIMNGTINVKYNIDLLTGTCNAMIVVSKNDVTSVLYSFSGMCNSQIPISGNNMSQVVSGIVSSIGNIATGFAKGGMIGGAVETAISVANNVVGSKGHVERSGNMNTVSGIMGVKTPYLIIQRPQQSLPTNFNTVKGFPSNITAKLLELNGYTEIDYVNLNTITATKAEIDEIDRLLKTGVIL